MSKKEKNLAYYKKLVIVDLWVLLIVCLLPFILSIATAVAAGLADFGSLFSTVFAALGLFSLLLVLRRIDFICCMHRFNQKGASGFWNIKYCFICIVFDSIQCH